MDKLTRYDLLSLEQYAEQRAEFRRQALAHKRNRKLAVGPNVTLLFEDRLTIQYQVQEMLRIERIFEPAAVQDELDAYNPLIPDGRNWKATMLIEFPDVEERKRELARLAGIEHKIWFQVAGRDRITPLADEDLERSTPEKTAAVHFLRIDLDDASIAAFKGGASLAVGVDHEHYAHVVDPVPGEIGGALLGDLD